MILKFTKTFEDKNSLHTYLESFKQGDSLNLYQSTLSYTIRGYLQEKKIRKKVEDG